MITEEGYNNSSAKMVEKGDLLLAMYGATSGDIAISRIKGAINQAILCIKTNHNKKFLETIWSKHVNRILKTYLQGGQGNLSADVVKQITFSIPTIQEQEKLAQLFFILDERITTQNKIIDKLESLIKGITQRIVHGNKPNTQITNCLKCSSSSLQESEVKETGIYPVYGANGIVGYLDNYSTKNEAIYIIKDGSGVGSVSYVKGECSATGTLNILEANKDFSLLYLYYILKIFNFNPYRTGMAIPHIYFKDYSKAKIFCPPYEKQVKYAKLLSAIEEKLITEQKILDSINLQKQYLLRQMFI
jgi:restriction endonuclease, S subunit